MALDDSTSWRSFIGISILDTHGTQRKAKPSHLCKSDSKVAQLNIINKAAEWKDSTNPKEAAV